MRFKLVTSTIRYICDTQHLDIISIISCFNKFLFLKQYYHYTIYDIILISVHSTYGSFTLYFSCHSQYIYYCDYFCLSVDYIAYLPTLRCSNPIICRLKSRLNTFNSRRSESRGNRAPPLLKFPQEAKIGYLVWVGVI